MRLKFGAVVIGTFAVALAAAGCQSNTGGGGGSTPAPSVTGKLSYDDVLRMASAARGPDESGYRTEFLELVRAAKSARSMAQLER